MKRILAIILSGVAVICSAAPSFAQQDTLRILGVGNSWTRDSMRWLSAIAKSAGKPVIVGHAYLGGSTLEQQYHGIDDTTYTYKHRNINQVVHNTYQYWKYTGAENPVKTPSEGYNNPEEENFVYNNTTFMNRSLGALNYRKGEARTAGWLYQWGRKDPFPPTATEGTKGENAPIQLYDANGTLLPAVDTNSELDSQIPKADVGMADSNLAFSIANPYTFIYNTINKSNTAAQPIHWITSNANSDAITASLWSGVKKTVYDPCPAGWQVSATNFWTNDPDKHNSLTYTTGASTYDEGANGSIVNVLDKESVWFPFQGYRKAISQGVQGNCGDVAVVWSVNCHADALRTWAVKIRAADYRTMIDYPRADGLAVRCVKIAQ